MFGLGFRSSGTEVPAGRLLGLGVGDSVSMHRDRAARRGSQRSGADVRDVGYSAGIVCVSLCPSKSCARAALTNPAEYGPVYCQ